MDAPQTAGEHLSGYDLMIVVNQPSLVYFATCWDRAEDRIKLDTGIITPVNFMAHTIDDVNSALSEGKSFFTHHPGSHCAL